MSSWERTAYVCYAVLAILLTLAVVIIGLGGVLANFAESESAVIASALGIAAMPFFVVGSVAIIMVQRPIWRRRCDH